MTQKSRAVDARKTDQRKDQYYRPPSEYKLPPEIIEKYFTSQGYVFRWIAVEIEGKDHRKNISKKLRDGWEWVYTSDIEELRDLVDSRTIGSDRKKVITVGDVALAKKPIAQAELRRKYYEDMALDQERAMLGKAREGDGGVSRSKLEHYTPLEINTKSETTFGDGRKTPGFGETQNGD
jgi:hypothetical protein